MTLIKKELKIMNVNTKDVVILNVTSNDDFCNQLKKLNIFIGNEFELYNIKTDKLAYVSSENILDFGKSLLK